METRILREFKFLRLLNAQEDIVSVKDVMVSKEGEVFANVFLVSELLSTELWRLLLYRAALSNARLKLLMFQLLCGVHYLHSSHVFYDVPGLPTFFSTLSISTHLWLMHNCSRFWQSSKQPVTWDVSVFDSGHELAKHFPHLSTGLTETSKLSHETVHWGVAGWLKVNFGQLLSREMMSIHTFKVTISLNLITATSNAII